MTPRSETPAGWDPQSVSSDVPAEADERGRRSRRGRFPGCARRTVRSYCRCCRTRWVCLSRAAAAPTNGSSPRSSAGTRPPGYGHGPSGTRSAPLRTGAATSLSWPLRSLAPRPATGCGWRADGDELLDPAGPTLADALRAAAGRGALLGGLLWRSHLSAWQYAATQNRRLAEAVGARCTTPN